MKRSQPRRSWDDARAKVEAEGACRNCGRSGGYPLEAAHIIGRDRDRFLTLPSSPTATIGASAWRVHPTRIIPLCRLCHGAEHRHELDTLPLLDLDEQLQAVADAGGIEQARVRLCPSQYRDRRAA